MMDKSAIVFGANIARFVASSGMSVNRWANTKGLPQRQVDRVIKGLHAVTLDTLDAFAEKLEVMPWQLLTPHLDLTNPPHIAITDAELQLYKRLRDLSRQSIPKGE